MGNGYPVVRPDELADLKAKIQEAFTKIRELERPTGTQISDAVATLQALVDGLLNQVNVTATGYVSAGTTITAGGNITSTSGYIFTAAGYAFDITYTRRAAWLGNDGRLGWASSSVTGKDLIDTLEQPDALKILSLVPRYYQRKAEIEKRDDPKSPDYRGPSYHVATEWGGLAEDFHAAGLWQVVIYEWDVAYDLTEATDPETGEIVTDEDGKPVQVRVGEPHRLGKPRPIGLHYELMGLLAIWAAQHIWTEHLSLVARVAALEA